MNRLEFAQAYEANFRRVYNYISYRIDNCADVEDLVSLVFMRALEKQRTFDPQKGTAQMWIISIARNAVIDYHRGQAQRRHLDIDDLAPVLPSPDPAPDSLVVNGEQRRSLLKALTRLSDRERQAIALKYGAGLGNRQIAAQMALPPSHVGVILFRSIRKLRKALNEEENL